MKTLKQSAAIAAFAASALVLTACSPGSDSTIGTPDPTDATASTDTEEATSAPVEDATTVTFRLWDDVAGPAYQESFDAFNAQNPDIKVVVDVVGWGDYWERMPLDIQSGDMADIFWVNSSGYGIYADNGNLINIDDALGADHDEWVESATSLYNRGGTQWGVPQIWDSIALFYNKDLVDEAGVDVESLKWSPDGDGDTLIEAATALTTDAAGLHPGDEGFDPDARETFGFNSQADMQAVYLDFLAQNGATFQDDDDNFAFATDEGAEAFQYLIDLINEHYVAPSAADTNADGDLTRSLFMQGKLGLFQSGPYSLKTIAENAEFDWGIAPLVEGPEGRISVVHSVAAVGNADSKNLDATIKVLQWLGSAEGQAALASQGVSFPAAVDAQDAFINYWAGQDVDVQPFIDAANGETTSPLIGAKGTAGFTTIAPMLNDMFLGETDVAEDLAAIQAEGNAAME